MKKLLIHNDNTTLLDNFSSSIKVSFSNEIDSYIDNNIIKKLEKEDFNIIYIKDNLSSNYLELYGLRVAYHIRLSAELKDKKYIPIVIFSDIDGFTLNRLEPMARILFTKNIFFIKNSKKAFDDFKDRDLKDLTTKEYQNSFLNFIDIDAPENSTSHSIANEWAIYRWAEFLKVESKSIQNNNNKINYMLYFKYLLAKNPIKKDRAIGYKRVKNSGKTLYIDDEWAKGWSDIFESYFNKSSNIDFKTFEYEFKDKNIFRVKIDIQKRVKEYNPDLVILDLRLIENDHKNINREDISRYTGIQILEDIKKINQGIQVLMLTSTSKSVILDKLYEYDILGYIKKEHPTDRNITTKENFDKLAKLVDNGFEKSYLKEIWEIQQSIKPFSPDIKIEVDSVFEILNSDMKNRFIYAMFAIFKSIEMVNDYYIIDGYKKATWKDTQEEFSDNSTKNKIYMILDKKLNQKDIVLDNNIEEIIKIRNNTIHPKKGKIEKISKENILTWFKMLQAILVKIEKVT